MKTTRTILRSKNLYLTFSLFLVMACGGPGKETPVVQEPADAPKQIISEEQAAVLFDTYSTNRVPCIEEFQKAAMKEGDEEHIVARYTSFDFKVMQEYMKYIEEQATIAGKDIKTLRIYYATYPDASEKDPNKNTVFLVPTTDFGRDIKAFKIAVEGDKHMAEAIPWNFDLRGQVETDDQKNQAGFFPMMTTNTLVHPGGHSLILNDGSTAPPPPNQ